MRYLIGTVITVALFLCVLAVLRAIGLEAEVFDFIGRLAFAVGLVYAVEPVTHRIVKQ